MRQIPLCHSYDAWPLSSLNQSRNLFLDQARTENRIHSEDSQVATINRMGRSAPHNLF